ncbi:MAG: hypothetical protein KKB81_03105 [Candidatus Margulisbacteria bacterium]|nr:hypothetical protein [Candidatus Margulisiibacteriota bacterium]MBU1022233.1 hypothetical protein [Candidatus Margulisiibacteriota bacterium]MBU1729328.1 hypothetical protein [Candidatus Margulisiibacteriota bacterium]MBU1955601.1 hypothetical protein [Candidatus Margulisiibacteriota bacterium]
MRVKDLNEFDLKIIGPYETRFRGKVVSLLASTPVGKVGILAHHAPYLSIIKEGKIEFILKSGENKSFELDGGLLKVKNNQATVVYF